MLCFIKALEEHVPVGEALVTVVRAVLFNMIASFTNLQLAANKAFQGKSTKIKCYLAALTAGIRNTKPEFNVPSIIMFLLDRYKLLGSLIVHVITFSVQEDPGEARMLEPLLSTTAPKPIINDQSGELVVLMCSTSKEKGIVSLDSRLIAQVTDHLLFVWM